MKFFFVFMLFLLIIGCANNNVVYWCGDHPCINKKEKEAYFKKTMIVEVKDLSKEELDNKSEINKIKEQAIIDEKKRIKEEKELKKQTRLDQKKRIKEEKKLEKQAKLEEKRRLREEKKLEKQVKVDKKKSIKKKVSSENIELTAAGVNIKVETNKFNDLVEKITKKSILRPYPDINDIPN